MSRTAGARRHGISRAQVRHVLEHCGLIYVRAASPPDRPDDALLYLGDDEARAAIEVIGVELDDRRMRVSHAMPMRASYRPMYEEAKKWRR